MIVVHANYLASIGHEVSIITAVLDTVFTIDQRITIKKLPAKNKLGTIVTAVLTKFKSDLVIADIIAIVCLLSFRNRNKLVCFAQDYDESYYTSRLQKRLIRFFYFIGLRVLRIPAIAVSHQLADRLMNSFRARVTVAENGVDTNIFYPDPDQELVKEKGQRKAIVVLSRSDRRKGFDIARDVLMRLAETHAGLFVVWTVGEPVQGVFPGLVHRHLGYVGEERLRKILSSADLFLYPSRHEGFPLMVLEGFACRCPVVTTEAVPYAVDNVNALVSMVEDVDSLVISVSTLLNDTALAAELAEQAYLFAKQHSLVEASNLFSAQLILPGKYRG